MINQVIARIEEAIENAWIMRIRITIKGDSNCCVTHMIPETYELDENVITVYDGDDYICINLEYIVYREEDDEYFSTSETSLIGFTFINSLETININ